METGWGTGRRKGGGQAAGLRGAGDVIGERENGRMSADRKRAQNAQASLSPPDLPVYMSTYVSPLPLLLDFINNPTLSSALISIQQGCVLAGDAGESVSVDESGGCIVWRGSERGQSLPHPSGLWCVCALPNGDFATGCQVRWPSCHAP